MSAIHDTQSSLLEAVAPRLRFMAETLREVARRPSALIGGAMIAMVLLVSLSFPLFYSVDPLEQDLMARFTPPLWQDGGTWTYPLGADNLGRDVLVRLLYGSRVSLLVGFAAVLVAELAGIPTPAAALIGEVASGGDPGLIVC